MKEVLALIKQKKQEYTQLPLHEFLRDTSIDPRQRLAWAPCFAPFAMNFKDINKYVFWKEPAGSKIQEMINKHTEEDGRHWKWFLEDMGKLGIDQSIKFSDALRFLWGEETLKTRQVSNELFALCHSLDDPLLMLVVIEVIEETGNVSLCEVSRVSQELQKITNQKYRYFSTSHYSVEDGHIRGGIDDVVEFLESIQLTEEQRTKAFELVEKIFAGFSESMNEMYEFAVKHSYDQPFSEVFAPKISSKAA